MELDVVLREHKEIREKIKNSEQIKDSKSISNDNKTKENLSKIKEELEEIQKNMIRLKNKLHKNKLYYEVLKNNR